MKNKKGVSAILSYVLLITLTIILAVIVTVYMKNKAKEQAEIVTQIAGTQLDCDSVAINGYLEGDDIIVTNVGAKTVFLDVRYQTNDAGNLFISMEHNGADNKGVKPKPYGASDSGDFKIRINVANRLNKVEVIPKVMINKKKVGCAEKKLVVS